MEWHGETTLTTHMKHLLLSLILLVAGAALCHGQQPTNAAIQQQKVDVVNDANYENGPSLHYDGIDVSSYQKDIDWSTTASDRNIKFVFVKATEGATHKSRHYRRNIDHARRQGVKVGSYHFLRTTSTIDAQFANFTSIVKLEEQDILPLIDVETRRGWSNKQLQDSVKKFADMLEKHYGVKPMIYTSSSFFNNILGPDFAHYPLFIARYSKSEPTLSYGAKWTLWQFSDRGRIKGIDAYVDLCRFNKGCNLNNILIAGKSTRHRGRVPQTVPEPRKKHQAAKPDVPQSKKQKKEAEKRRKEEEKKRKEAQKKAEKEAKEKQKEQERIAKEQQRIEKEREKRRREEEKKNKNKQNQVPPPQKPKVSPRGQSQANVPAKPVQSTSVSSTTTTQPTPAPTQTRKRNNQSSADNDKVNYSTRKNRNK